MQSTPLSRKILLFPTSRIRQDSPVTGGSRELAIARTAAARVVQQSWLIASAIDIVFCLALRRHPLSFDSLSALIMFGYRTR